MNRISTPVEFKIKVNEYLEGKTAKIDIPQPPDLQQKIDLLQHQVLTINESRFNKLRRIYRYWDDTVGFFSQYASCSKGCHYCCYYDVQITPLEAEHISRETGIKRNEPKGLVKTGHNAGCVFLGEKGRCSIYEYRPLTCRAFTAFGPPELCDGGTKKQAHIGNASTAGPGEPLIISIQLIAHIMKKMVMYDIRQFFTAESVNK